MAPPQDPLSVPVTGLSFIRGLLLPDGDGELESGAAEAGATLGAADTEALGRADGAGEPEEGAPPTKLSVTGTPVPPPGGTKPLLLKVT
jgi:hypothetical protein